MFSLYLIIGIFPLPKQSSIIGKAAGKQIDDDSETGFMLS